MPATPSNYTTSSSEFLKFLETCEEVLWQVVSWWTTTHHYSFCTLSLLKQWPGLPQMVSHAFLRMTLIGSLTSALTLLWATKTHTVNTKTRVKGAEIWLEQCLHCRAVRQWGGKFLCPSLTDLFTSIFFLFVTLEFTLLLFKIGGDALECYRKQSVALGWGRLISTV